jgi:hypothetical protein
MEEIEEIKPENREEIGEVENVMVMDEEKEEEIPAPETNTEEHSA